MNLSFFFFSNSLSTVSLPPMLLLARYFLFLVYSVTKIVFIQVAWLKEQKPLNDNVLIS